MRQIKIIVILLLFTMPHVCGMEIYAEIKNREKRVLINEGKGNSYSSLAGSVINNSPNYAYSPGLMPAIKQLPKDIRKYIKNVFFSLYLNEFGEKRKKEFLFRHSPTLVLKHILRAESLCPLTIGNKTFSWKDLIVLKKDAQEDLYTLGNPNACYSCITGFDNTTIEASGSFCSRALYCMPEYFCNAKMPDINNLENQSARIKKDLTVDTSDYAFACCICIPCSTGSAITSVAVVQVFSACCSLSSQFFAVPIVCCAINLCAYPLNRLLIKQRCGCCTSNETCPLRKRRMG